MLFAILWRMAVALAIGNTIALAIAMVMARLMCCLQYYGVGSSNGFAKQAMASKQSKQSKASNTSKAKHCWLLLMLMLVTRRSLL